jgi:hypothetical protein
MSQKNFNAAGVPWYADGKLPAIRPRELPPMSQETQDWKARKMAATHYVRAAVREKWKSGDRFYITTAPRTYYDFTSKKNETRQCSHAGKTGTFLEVKIQGSTYFAFVKWDDPEYKPIGLYNKISVYDLYHFGFTIEEAAAFVEET